MEPMHFDRISCLVALMAHRSLMEEQVLADLVQHVPGLCVPALGADFSWPLQLCPELSFCSWYK